MRIWTHRERRGVYMEEKDKKEFEEVISSYYGEEQVAALVTFKIDTKGSDQVAQKIASHPYIEDVFLVTGDTDIIAKARFPNYAALKKFIVDDVADIDGIKESKTFMVVTTFKERGELRLDQEEEAKK
jgi:DNA-binding Lrp family transcriptional regulator